MAVLRGRSGVFWRASFLVVIAIWFGAFLLRPSRLQWLGFNSYPLFIDSLALLSAGEAHEQGYDVYRPIALDPFHRPHSYPSYWLLLGKIGLTRTDNRWFGPLAVALFGLALAATVRPASGPQFAEACLVACSGGIMLAVSRANNDLWIFALYSLLVPIVLARERPVRLLGPFIAACGAALKYYPAIGAVVLAAEPTRRGGWRQIAIFAVLLTIVGAGLVADIRHFRATQPAVDQFLSFGAPLVLRQIGIPSSWQMPIPIVAGATITIVGFVLTNRFRLESRIEENPASTLRFVLAAALLAGCFWTAPNWGYRWIFGLWLLPGFWSVGAAPTSRGQVALWIVLRFGWWLLLWFELVCVWLKRLIAIPDAAILAAWWACQGIAWLWFSLLTAIVAAFVWGRWFGNARVRES